MKHVILSKFRYSKGRFLILCSVLCLSMLVWNLSVQLFWQSLSSARIIEENTTTLAIENLSVVRTDESLTISYHSPAVQKAAQSSSAVLSPHPSTTVGGRAENLTPSLPPLSRQTNGENNAANMLHTENFGIFHIRCDRITQQWFEEFTEEENPAQRTYHLSYTVEATVLSTVMLNSEFRRPPETLQIGCSYALSDGSIPYQAGEEYIVCGHYSTPLAWKSTNKLGKTIYSMAEDPYDPYTLFQQTSKSFTTREYGQKTGEDGHLYKWEILPESHPPFVLKTEDPRLPEMYEWVQLNMEMLAVTGVSTIQGIPLFAMKEAYLKTGRDMTAEEANAGANVCIISQTLANKHGLKTGDHLTLSLYPLHVYTGFDNLYAIADLPPQSPQQQTEYEIIGTYNAPEWEYSRFAFSPNTIFVPENSLHVQGGTEGLDYSDSLILKNGSNEQFFTDLESAGFDRGLYIVYDGGYVEFMESLQLMQRDTGMVLIVCQLLFLVLCSAALYTTLQHLQKDGDIMEKAGATPQYAQKYALLCLIPCILLSLALSYLLAWRIHAPMMRLMEDWYALQRPIFSNLPVGSDGMLENTMQSFPTVIAPAAALVMTLSIALLLVFFRRERRKT